MEDKIEKFVLILLVLFAVWLGGTIAAPKPATGSALPAVLTVPDELTQDRAFELPKPPTKE